MSERDRYRKASQTQTPEQLKPRKKRDAPSAEVPIRQDPERQAQEYGRPTTFRIPDSVREALDEAEAEYRIAKRDLVLYFVVKGLLALQGGKVDLPIEEEEGRRLCIPEI